MSSDNPIVEVKEFYTREGKWILLDALDYTKSTNNSSQYNNTITNTNNPLLATTATTTTVNTTINNTGTNYIPNQNIISNEPVKAQFLTISSYKCENCNNRIEFTNDLKTSSSDTICKYCNQKSNNSIINKSLLEILIFNFSREIYCFYYNGIKQVKSTFLFILFLNLF
jgi:DNA-directed RNA polymerase subunit RPC12/RpoP